MKARVSDYKDWFFIAAWFMGAVFLPSALLRFLR